MSRRLSNICRDEKGGRKESIGGMACLGKEGDPDLCVMNGGEDMARAPRFQVDAYPAALKKFQHSAGVNSLQILPITLLRSSKVRAAAARRWAFSFEKAISMGFRSGEYFGR